uniref:Uncharacterized protein n=1 Tax=Timema genevievae TaxID=629358 RepID=A0A7R9PRH3_TIMGE|nr:unnamed protein product [Timema genevievae]
MYGMKQQHTELYMGLVASPQYKSTFQRTRRQDTNRGSQPQVGNPPSRKVGYGQENRGRRARHFFPGQCLRCAGQHQTRRCMVDQTKLYCTACDRRGHVEPVCLSEARHGRNTVRTHQRRHVDQLRQASESCQAGKHQYSLREQHMPVQLFLWEDTPVQQEPDRDQPPMLERHHEMIPQREKSSEPGQTSEEEIQEKSDNEYQDLYDEVKESADEEVVKPDKVQVNQLVVVTQNQVTCRLPEYFSEPDKFIPERWIKGHQMYKSTSPYLVLPFGHGPRTCIARRLAEQNMQALRGTLSEREKERVRQTETRHIQGCTAVAVTREIDGEVEEEGEAELISGDKTSQ